MQKTPYQGKNRVWGEFRPTCNHYSSSGNSWANMGQKCKKCYHGVHLPPASTGQTRFEWPLAWGSGE